MSWHNVLFFICQLAQLDNNPNMIFHRHLHLRRAQTIVYIVLSHPQSHVDAAEMHFLVSVGAHLSESIRMDACNGRNCSSLWHNLLFSWLILFDSIVRQQSKKLVNKSWKVFKLPFCTTTSANPAIWLVRNHLCNPNFSFSLDFWIGRDFTSKPFWILLLQAKESTKFPHFPIETRMI